MASSRFAPLLGRDEGGSRPLSLSPSTLHLLPSSFNLFSWHTIRFGVGATAHTARPAGWSACLLWGARDSSELPQDPKVGGCSEPPGRPPGTSQCQLHEFTQQQCPLHRFRPGSKAGGTTGLFHPPEGQEEALLHFQQGWLSLAGDYYVPISLHRLYWARDPQTNYGLIFITSAK